jgi:hypothetical protein
VTVKGSGFTGAASVTFGRFPDAAIRAAGFTVVDDNTITATSPAEYTSQTVDVAVFGPGGDSSPCPATSSRTTRLRKVRRRSRASHLRPGRPAGATR